MLPCSRLGSVQMMLPLLLLLLCRGCAAFLSIPSKPHGCPASCTFKYLSSRINTEPAAFMDEVVRNTTGGGLDLVSAARKHLTMTLTKAAVETCEAGAIVETGVFTGGSTITIMKTLQDMDMCSRQLWAFDSFQGLPQLQAADLKGTADMVRGAAGLFASTQAVFEGNMKAAGAWDDRLHVVPGWFNESIPTVKASIGPIAFLRLDGDLYQSTRDVLELLYDQVIPGGLIYVDDYGSFTGCKRAVDEFFAQRRVWSPLHVYDRDKEAAWWRKL